MIKVMDDDEDFDCESMWNGMSQEEKKRMLMDFLRKHKRVQYIKNNDIISKIAMYSDLNDRDSMRQVNKTFAAIIEPTTFECELKKRIEHCMKFVTYLRDTYNAKFTKVVSIDFCIAASSVHFRTFEIDFIWGTACNRDTLVYIYPGVKQMVKFVHCGKTNSFIKWRMNFLETDKLVRVWNRMDQTMRLKWRKCMMVYLKKFVNVEKIK